jgi:hypothetical protein
MPINRDFLHVYAKNLQVQQDASALTKGAGCPLQQVKQMENKWC